MWLPEAMFVPRFRATVYIGGACWRRSQRISPTCGERISSHSCLGARSAPDPETVLPVCTAGSSETWERCSVAPDDGWASPRAALPPRSGTGTRDPIYTDCGTEISFSQKGGRMFGASEKQ
jgi:hypothetical protein